MSTDQGVLDLKADAVARESNKLTLVLYGVPEELQDKSCVNQAEIAYQHLLSIAPEAVSCKPKEEYGCLGKSSSKSRQLLGF